MIGLEVVNKRVVVAVNICRGHRDRVAYLIVGVPASLRYRFSLESGKSLVPRKSARTVRRGQEARSERQGRGHRLRFKLGPGKVGFGGGYSAGKAGRVGRGDRCRARGVWNAVGQRRRRSLVSQPVALVDSGSDVTAREEPLAQP
jgi:hypothetical protein